MYSQNIANFQNTLNQNANDVLTSNVLVKRAFPLSFYINAFLTLVANADGPATRSAVKNALIQFLDNYRLGAGIQESDIIIVMQQGYGDFPVSSVDAVVINSYYLMDEFGTTYLPVASTIAVANTQYVVYGNAVLT
jgi:phage-related baseplate assembly protein